MRTARFFVAPEWLAPEEHAFAIPHNALYRQITAVLRLGVNDHISLLPNTNIEYDCCITHITPQTVSGTIKQTFTTPPPLPEITVCFGMLKNDHVALILEKCTELGATTFLPLITARTIKKPDSIPPRWEAIIKEASEQSGRTRLPVLLPPATFAKGLDITDGMRRIILHEPPSHMEDDTSPHTHHLPHIESTDRVAVFIGPEGGFTDEEIARAQDASSHIVSLGNLVLRAETAAIIATGLLRLQS